MNRCDWVIGLAGLILVSLIGLPQVGMAAEKRVALVIGNGGYAESPLSQPGRNVKDLVVVLKKLGFDPVLTATDVNLSDFEGRVRQFLDAGRQAQLRLFYYAGHGETYRNQTYLLPVGHGVQRAYELPTKAYPMTRLMEGFRWLDGQGSEGVNLVLLDACRNTRVGGESFGSDEALGLGEVPRVSGTLIAYATSAGEKAWGLGGDTHSLFTKHLLRRLPERDEIKLVLTRVRGDVRQENPAQITETSDQLANLLYLAGRDEPPPVTTGTLVIKDSQPPGVVIYVDGARLGTAPQRLEGLSAGKAVTVTARQSGYDDYQERVWIRGGQASELNVVLQRKEPVAPPVAATPAPVERPRPAMTGPAMVKITGGCFQMGSPASETGRESDEKQHRVCVESFEMGKDELTVGEFKQFITASGYKTDAEKNAGGKEGCFAWIPKDGKGDWRAGLSWRKPGYEQRDNYPVVCVSWNDALAYTRWLSEQTGQSYRLPTEAEWEYAARAGTTTARYWGDDPDQACQYANVADQTQGPEGHSWSVKHECKDGYWYPAPVGRFQANAFRLNDMLGNVWEWTCSAYDKDYGGTEKECADNSTGGPLSVRGGGWSSKLARVRSANRYRDTPAYRYFNTGFRLARSL